MNSVSSSGRYRFARLALVLMIGLALGTYQIAAVLAADVATLQGWTITFNGVTYNADGTSTWTYTIDPPGEDSPDYKDLSHWVLGLAVCDPTLTVDSSDPAYLVIGTDPTTGVYGIKWDEMVLKTGGAVTYSVTLDGWYAVAETPFGFKLGGDDFTGLIDGPACERVLDLELTKTANKSNPAPGQDVVLTIVVTNVSPNDATGVEVEDIAWPAKLTYKSDDSGGAYDPNSFIWTIGDLAAGASATLNITATVNDFGYWENIAEISACDQNDVDSTPANFATAGDEDDSDFVGGQANPTAVTLASFGAKSGALEGAAVLGIGLPILGFVAVSAVLWSRRRVA